MALVNFMSRVAGAGAVPVSSLNFNAFSGTATVMFWRVAYDLFVLSLTIIIKKYIYLQLFV